MRHFNSFFKQTKLVNCEFLERRKMGAYYEYQLVSVYIRGKHCTDIVCEQALLFGQAKRASREGASEGPRKGELATISHKFSFPPRKPRDSAKRENCHRKRAACQVSLDSRGRVELFIYKSLSQRH